MRIQYFFYESRCGVGVWNIDNLFHIYHVFIMQLDFWRTKKTATSIIDCLCAPISVEATYSN